MFHHMIRTTFLLALLAWGPPVSAESGAEQVLEALEGYMGHWRSDEKTDRNGNALHFEYTLEWLDGDHTIAAMLIERIASDGTRTVIFEGFKGREPSGESVYYFAASPSGRGARGTVALDGNLLVTRYEGWSADGAVVEIRDEFHPLEDDEFVSKTWLRASPKEEWRQVGEDRWSPAPKSS